MEAVAEVDEVEVGELSTPDPSFLFMARRSELRLTKRARYHKRNPHTGEHEGVTPGQSLGFKDGILRIPKSGTVHIQDTLDGGEWEAPAEEVLAYLRGHKLIGDVHEGFWEVDPVAPAPTTAELEALLEAATSLNREAMVRMLETERAGWGREQVITIIEGALARIDQIEAQAAADYAARQEAGPVVDTPETAGDDPQNEGE